MPCVALGGAHEHGHRGHGLHERIGEARREAALGAVGILRLERDGERHVIGEPDELEAHVLRMPGELQDRRWVGQRAVDADVQTEARQAGHVSLHNNRSSGAAEAAPLPARHRLHVRARAMPRSRGDPCRPAHARRKRIVARRRDGAGLGQRPTSTTRAEALVRALVAVAQSGRAPWRPKRPGPRDAMPCRISVRNSIGSRTRARDRRAPAPLDDHGANC